MPIRRRKNEPGGRHKIYPVRVSESEDQILKERANAAGITVSRLLAESALGDPSDALLRKTWRIQLMSLQRQMKESGYSQELQDKASELLARLGE